MEMYTSESPYSFTLNNPVNYTDPSGMSVESNGCSGRPGYWDRGTYVTCGGGGGSSTGGSNTRNIGSLGKKTSEQINYILNNANWQYGGSIVDGLMHRYNWSESIVVGYSYGQKFNIWGKNGANTMLGYNRDAYGMDYSGVHSKTGSLGGGSIYAGEVNASRNLVSNEVWMKENFVETTTLVLDDVTVTYIFENDKLDFSTIGQNIYLLGGRSTYAGGNNPKTMSGKYSYSYVPTMKTDYPAIGHDRRYDNLGINGSHGLFFDTRAIGADWRFVSEELIIATMTNDFETSFNASVLAIGLGVAALPKTIFQISIPNGFGFAESVMWYHVSNLGVTNKPSHKF